MAEVQSPPSAQAITPRFGRGRILRVLTLGKPQDTKTPRKGRTSREGQGGARDQRDSGESGTTSSHETRMLAPPKPSASDSVSLMTSPLTSDAESVPPISPARPEDCSPDTEEGPPTPNDPFSPSSMNAKQSPASPSLLKRFKTRLRSLSRTKDERPKIVSPRSQAPPVPTMPIAKDFGTASATQSSTGAPVRRLSRVNLLAAFSNKSTPSLVSPATPSSSSTVQPPVPRRSSVPRLAIPSTPTLQVPGAGEVDPALVPLPPSPLAPPFEVEKTTLSPIQSIDDRKDEKKDTPASVSVRPKTTVVDSPIVPRVRGAQESPMSKASAAHRSSKFFVGDSDDEDEDSPRDLGAKGSPPSARGSPRQRSATVDGSPHQAPMRRPTKSGRPSTADKRKMMFSSWRKSTDVATALSDIRTTHKRGPSIDSASSTDSTGARKVNPVSPTIHSGGFLHQEEEIKDPESRALTEIAFM